jgi:hypothetical protein
LWYDDCGKKKINEIQKEEEGGTLSDRVRMVSWVYFRFEHCNPNTVSVAKASRNNDKIR